MNLALQALVWTLESPARAERLLALTGLSPVELRAGAGEPGVLAAIPSPYVGLLYLVIFGVGTVAGMALITTMIAVPSAYSLSKFGHMQRYIQFASGALSVCFGLFLAHEVGVVNGLFGANPTWDPH